MCPSSGAARALLNIPKPARVRTSEKMERSDMFRERNERLSTVAQRRRGTVSGSYTLLLGGKDTIKARSQEGGGPEAAESCISKAKIGLRRHSQGQKTTGGWKAGIANR